MPEPEDEMAAYDRHMADLEQATVIDRSEDEDGDFTVTFTLHPRKP